MPIVCVAAPRKAKLADMTLDTSECLANGWSLGISYCNRGFSKNALNPQIYAFYIYWKYISE